MLLLLPQLLISQQQLVYTDSDLLLVKGSVLQILEDKTHRLTAEQVLHSSEFVSNKNDVPNLGVSESAFWIRLAIKNNSSHNKLLLNLAYPNLDDVELHFFTGTLHEAKKLGKDRPFGMREYKYPGYIFSLNLPAGDTAIALIRIRSGGQIMAPLYLGSEKQVMEAVRNENLIIGIYCGVILVMFFYNLFVYFSVKDKVYLYYVGYILIVGLVQLCLLGYTFQILWPNSPWLAHHSVYLLSAGSSLAIIEFIKVFLRTKEFTPWLHKGFYVLTIIYSVYVVLDLLNLGDKLYNLIQLFAMVLSIYILVVGVTVMRKKYRAARFLLLAWTIFLIGVFIYALKDVGILPYNNYTIFMMPVGSGIEAALISFALADKINIFRKEKEESQVQALALAMENERIIIDQNRVLEEKVRERTSELEASNKSLKEAEAHLVNAEKMASLGQLTAGISHEINNPINFVVSNVKPLKRDVDDLLTVLSYYSQISSPEQFSERMKDIEELKRRLDLEYVTKEINQLLKGIDEGANRTAEIVKGLKNFSRANEDSLKFVNLHEGIDATLTILNSNIQSSHINIVRNYSDKLPLVECHPGKINQVFMNIINNAIHAVVEKHKTDGEGAITVTTALKEQFAEVSIRDNGTGIPAANLQKIYEPFFTTKAVGMGTGLGLSIVYGIIQSHQGKIEVKSELGEGTEFIIRLTIRQK
jgi:signal transduction histidine kinase